MALLLLLASTSLSIGNRYESDLKGQPRFGIRIRIRMAFNAYWIFTILFIYVVLTNWLYFMYVYMYIWRWLRH